MKVWTDIRSGMAPPGWGVAPPPYFFFWSWSVGQCWFWSWSKMINLYNFLPFFSKINGRKWQKIYYWIKFHYQIGYKWLISDQKVTNCCSFYLNLLSNLLASWWKCSWSEQPTVGQNYQHLVIVIRAPHPPNRTDIKPSLAPQR